MATVTSTNNEILDQGMKIIQGAIRADKEGRFSEALDLYKKGLHYLHTALKYVKREAMRNLVRSKMTEYVDRAELIKKKLQEERAFLEETKWICSICSSRNQKEASKACAMCGAARGAVMALSGKGVKGTSPNTTQSELEARMSIEQLMESEFSKVIGHDNIKEELRMFHKKLKLDAIRARHTGKVPKRDLYHMIFAGPPGTGKTTMAKVMAKIMVKMGLLDTNKVIFVNNALELIAGHVGHTAPRVDAKCNEAAGGVLFIDEAYSIAGKSGSSDSTSSFHREAIDTLMKHLDPPTCVFIFAGYEKEMGEFLGGNQGLARRIPFRYNFEAYSPHDLSKILLHMIAAKGESVDQGMGRKLEKLLKEKIPQQMRETQNAGLIGNWLAFAQMHRDSHLDLNKAQKSPHLACHLSLDNFKGSLERLLKTG